MLDIIISTVHHKEYYKKNWYVMVVSIVNITSSLAMINYMYNVYCMPDMFKDGCLPVNC